MQTKSHLTHRLTVFWDSRPVQPIEREAENETTQASGYKRKKRFAWRDPPYEYEHVKLPFDILCGTDRVRKAIEGSVSPRRLAAGWKMERAAFLKRRKRYLLY